MDHPKNQTAAVCKSDLALSIIFCGALILGCLSLAVRMGTRVLMKLDLCSQSMVNVVFHDKWHMRRDFGLPSVNWQKLYPLSKDAEEYYKTEIQHEITEKRYVLQSVKVVAGIKKIDEWINEYFFLRDFFVTNSKQIEKTLGVAFLRRLRLADGKLTGFTPKRDVSQNAESLLKFNEYLNLKGIPFLYVQAPHKIPPEDPVSGTKNFANQNADDLLYLIDGTVDYLDLRAEIKKTGMNHYDCFLISDHHWKTDVGLWASKVIADKLNADFRIGLDTQVLDTSCFNFKVIPESFLGLAGREETLALVKMEDFTLITPKNEYDLDVEIYSSKNLQRKASGDFGILLFPENIQTRKTALQKQTYDIYLNGDTNTFIKNNSVQNNLQILFLGDSFTDVVEPFLALCVRNFDTLDLRSFNGSLSAFIDAHERYDACVMLVNPNSLGTDGDGKMLFDFR